MVNDFHAGISQFDLEMPARLLTNSHYVQRFPLETLRFIHHQYGLDPINDVNNLSEMEKYTTVMIMPFLSVLLYLRTYDIKVSGGYD